MFEVGGDEVFKALHVKKYISLDLLEVEKQLLPVYYPIN